MIKGYFGGQGSGKTLSAVWDMYKQHIRNDRRVLSNIKLNFEYTEICAKDIEQYTKDRTQINNSEIFIDEVHLWFNNRRSMSRKSVILGFMIAQMRKRDNTLYYTTQTGRKPDVLLREETDEVHQPQIMIDTNMTHIDFSKPLEDQKIKSKINLKRYNTVGFDKIPREILNFCWIKDNIETKEIIDGWETWKHTTRYFPIKPVTLLYDTTYVVGFD